MFTSLPSLLSLSSFPFQCILKSSYEVWECRVRPVSVHSEVKKGNKMIWVHKLCSLEANYKSQGRPNFWGCRTPQLEYFGWPDTHDTHMATPLRQRRAIPPFRFPLFIVYPLCSVHTTVLFCVLIQVRFSVGSASSVMGRAGFCVPLVPAATPTDLRIDRLPVSREPVAPASLPKSAEQDRRFGFLATFIFLIRRILVGCIAFVHGRRGRHRKSFLTTLLSFFV